MALVGNDKPEFGGILGEGDRYRSRGTPVSIFVDVDDQLGHHETERNHSIYRQHHRCKIKRELMFPFAPHGGDKIAAEIVYVASRIGDTDFISAIKSSVK